jgi:hypothetical protein
MKSKIEMELNQIKDKIARLSHDAFFGIEANDVKVAKIWDEYNSIRADLRNIDASFFENLIPLTAPEPDEADSLGIHNAGAKVYYSKHLESLETEIEKAFSYLELYKRKT